MDIKCEKLFLSYANALFQLNLQPFYGDSVWAAWGRYDETRGHDYLLRCCICADENGEWDKNKDWIIEFVHLESEDGIRWNTEHPYYNEETKEYLDDFIEEITAYLKFLNS